MIYQQGQNKKAGIKYLKKQPWLVPENMKAAVGGRYKWPIEKLCSFIKKEQANQQYWIRTEICLKKINPVVFLIAHMPRQ